MHEKYLKMARDIFAKVAQRSVRMWKYILKLKGVAQWALQNLARMSRDSQHSTTHESDTSSFLLEMATTLSEDGLNNPQNLPVLVLHGSTVVYTSSCSGWISFWPSQMVGQLWISDFSAHLPIFHDVSILQGCRFKPQTHTGNCKALTFALRRSSSLAFSEVNGSLE